MKIDTNKVVSVAFRVFDENNNLLEDSGDDPIQFIYGENVLLEKIDQELKGKSVGETVIINLEAKDAYGDYVEELSNRSYPKDMFGKNSDQIQVGQYYQIGGLNAPALALVTGIEEDSIILDLNQPLAGKDLRFEFDVLEVREATEHELKHGIGHSSCNSCCGHQH